ncbi:MAG: glycosyltransferase [Proteobacteria bacterium]|nr:glycosyltransferase [Pseudomonadota bacterium]
MKIDLHVHSKHSDRPSQWVLRKINCPESFVEPTYIYKRCRELGMDRVTISDHNTISGALSIAHLPGTFVSEEITTYFPYEHCKIHVLVWDINEEIHREITKCRKNIYDLADYLRENNICHGVAHPLYAVNDRLTLEHVEQLLVMFSNFECNGTRDAMQDTSLLTILDLLNEEIIGELAGKHNLTPAGDVPWEKSSFGGSDDHSGLNIARIHTVAENAKNLDEFFQAMSEHRTKADGRHASPKTMAHNLYSIGYQFFRQKYKLGRRAHMDTFLSFLDMSLMPLKRRRKRDRLGSVIAKVRSTYKDVLAGITPTPDEVPQLLRIKAETAFRENTVFRDNALNRFKTDPKTHSFFENDWFSFTNHVAGDALVHYWETFVQSLDNGNIFKLFSTLAASGALYTALGPYLVAYSLFTKDRAFCRNSLSRIKTMRGLDISGDKPPFRMAHFTDTFFDTNGVAKTIREQVRMAQNTGKPYTVITCNDIDEDHGPGVMNYSPIGSSAIPEYSDLKLYCPPFLEMLACIYENEFTHIHCATPGPVGLAGLGIARILGISIASTYHTAFPQYALQLTDDPNMEEMMWRFMIWFYNQMDKVYVPSKAVGEELKSHGIEPGKITFYPRGVDTQRFTPAKRNGFYKNYNLKGDLKLLYVGRVSKEKNLHILEEAFSILKQRHSNIDLVIVGDGPYREEMVDHISGDNCLFTGMLQDEKLSAAYASSDLFIFPSTTDTFGKVILEAQASGVPVVVTDQGGPQENLLDGETGAIVPGEDPQALADVVSKLIADPDQLRNMGERARTYMESRSADLAFDKAWEIYAANE